MKIKFSNIKWDYSTIDHIGIILPTELVLDFTDDEMECIDDPEYAINRVEDIFDVSINEFQMEVI